MGKPKPRNLLVLHPLMKKGRAHRKTAKAERQVLKRATRELIAEARRYPEQS